MLKYGIQDVALIGEVIELTGASLVDEIALIPQIAAIPGAHEGRDLSDKIGLTFEY